MKSISFGAVAVSVMGLSLADARAQLPHPSTRKEAERPGPAPSSCKRTSTTTATSGASSMGVRQRILRRRQMSGDDGKRHPLGARNVVPEQIGGSYTGDPDLGDVVVRAEFTIVSGEGVAGVYAGEAADTDAEAEWYEFVVRDGFAASARRISRATSKCSHRQRRKAPPWRRVRARGDVQHWG